MRFLHTMVRVTNIEESLNFYCNLLGLIEVKRNEFEKGRFTLIFLSAPEDYNQARITQSPLIELTYNWDSEAYSEGRIFGHLAYVVKDIYSLCARLQKGGVVISRPPRDGHMAFVRSPDNVSIELLQEGSPLAPQEPWSTMPNTGAW